MFSVFMSWPSTIYVVSMQSIFHFQPHFHYNQSYNLVWTDTLVFCEYLLLFSDDNVDEESE